MPLREARGEVVAKPVDAFTRASEGTIEQAPQRPYEVPRPQQGNRLLDLSRALGVAAETASTISNKQYQEYAERATAAGAALQAQDELEGNKRSFRQAISQTRREVGEDAARDLMGMSPHIKKGYDQTRARSAALGYNAAYQAAYAANPLLDEESGLRLHDVDTESKEFSEWSATFRQAFDAEQGISQLDPTALATVIPAVQDVETRVRVAHDELRSARKLEAFENSTAEFVSDALHDLNGNAGWVQGQDSDALLFAANLLSNQLDEANALGYGGEDLQALYALTVEQVLAVATTTENPTLLDILEFVEVGPKNARQLLMNTAGGAKYRQAAAAAAQSIADRKYTTSQRERQVRDQQREDAMQEAFERISIMSGLYENAGRTPEARQALNNVVEAGRIAAAEYGFTVEFNSAVTRVLQESVDNQGVNIVDYPAMTNLENSIELGQMGGETAQRRLRDMYMSGALGNNQEASDNFMRISSKIKASDDQALAAFANEVSQASNAFLGVVQQRAGYTEDERGRLTSIKETLNGAGWSDSQIRSLTRMSQQEAEAYIIEREQAAINNEGLAMSASEKQALNLVVNEGLDPLNPPAPLDAGDLQRQKIQFENDLYRSFTQFREREGRDMTPQERSEFIRQATEAHINGQRATLPLSNPLSSLRDPQTGLDQYQTGLYNNIFDGVGDATGNPNTDQLLDAGQLAKAYEHFVLTGRWHPEVVELARQNNATPMSLIQKQSALHGAEIDPDLMVAVGMPIQPRASDSLPYNSAFANRKDISADYTPGQYTTFTGFFIDDSPPGSYDFTFLQNGRDKVNVPAPFDGVVISAGVVGGYGNTVVIQDRSTGHQMRIAHADSLYLRAGDRFVKGQALLRQGTTGNSTGPHLHVELLSRKGQRITNRAYSRPFIEEWIDYVEGGSYMQSSPTPLGGETSSQQYLRPNNKPPLYGHSGYDEAPQSSLETVYTEQDGSGREYKLDKRAAAAWRRMVNDARYEGIELRPVSAFRTVEEQRYLWERQIGRQGGSEERAARISAPPGHSEHHTGLTVDINSLDLSFKNTPAYQWLRNNAARYGFTQSFDGSGHVTEEPWHWSFTGPRGGQGGPGASQGNAIRATRNQSVADAINKYAPQLGVSPTELASLSALESSLDINARGGDGGRYVGLFQFGPEEQRMYGVYQGQPAEQQLQALVRFATDRGYRPEMGIAELYSTILAGSPGRLNARDSNGTSAGSAARQFQPGGRYYRTAQQVLGF